MTDFCFQGDRVIKIEDEIKGKDTRLRASNWSPLKARASSPFFPTLDTPPPFTLGWLDPRLGGFFTGSMG
jgi:hypothetical protein